MTDRIYFGDLDNYFLKDLVCELYQSIFQLSVYEKGKKWFQGEAETLFKLEKLYHAYMSLRDSSSGSDEHIFALNKYCTAANYAEPSNRYHVSIDSPLYNYLLDNEEEILSQDLATKDCRCANGSPIGSPNHVTVLGWAELGACAKLNNGGTFNTNARFLVVRNYYVVAALYRRKTEIKRLYSSTFAAFKMIREFAETC
jgi:hypothetical protein